MSRVQALECTLVLALGASVAKSTMQLDGLNGDNSDKRLSNRNCFLKLPFFQPKSFISALLYGYSDQIGIFLQPSDSCKGFIVEYSLYSSKARAVHEFAKATGTLYEIPKTSMRTSKKLLERAAKLHSVANSESRDLRKSRAKTMQGGKTKRGKRMMELCECP